MPDSIIILTLYDVAIVHNFLFVIRNLKESGEIIFVDSTSNLDRTDSYLTPLLCSSGLGSLPLGFIITSNQSEDCYKTGKYTKLLT